MSEPAGPFIEEEPVEQTASAPKRSNLTWFIAWRLLVIAAFIAVALAAYVYGQRLRTWTWNDTQPIHFFHDVNNGYFWGSQAWEPKDQPPGILNVYDVVARRAEDRSRDDTPEYRLDYAPLRLTLISKWVKWGQTAHPQVAARARRSAQFGSNPTVWETPFDFFAPMLHFNTAMELVAVIGLLLLTRHWVIRGDPKPVLPAQGRWPWRMTVGWFTRPNPFRGWVAAAIAGLLFWFNPAILLSAHGWPTWDMWVIPFFVWALYLACIDCWYIAGLVVAAGAMFKGQQLFGVPFFLLWPIFMGRPTRALRFLCGLVLGVGAIATPWLLTYNPPGVAPAIGSRVLDRPATAWVATVTLLLIGLPPLLRWLQPFRLRRRKIEAEVTDDHTPVLAYETPQYEQLPRWQRLARWAAWLAPAIGLAVLITWPFRSAGADWRIGATLGTIACCCVLLLPLRQTPYLAAAGLGVSLLLCMVLFHGSDNWLKIGWGYGTRHYPMMQVGQSDNLAGILQKRYGWDPDDLVLRFGGGTVVNMKTFLVSLFCVFGLLCTIGAAIQYRRNDPRFLVAATGLWVVWFAFMPQMHERYLIYAAGVGCCLVAMSTGFTLLGVFLSLWTTIMTFHPMFSTSARAGNLSKYLTEISPTASNTLFNFLRLAHPDAGYAVILCALIFTYVALAPGKRPLA